MNGPTVPSGEPQSTWSRAQTEIAQAHDILQRLLRIAGYLNHRLVILPTTTRVLDIVVIAKPGLAATSLAGEWSNHFAAAKPLSASCRIVELSGYSDLQSDPATHAASAAAIIFLSSVLAPALDETLECINRHFPNRRDRILIALTNLDANAALADDIIAETREDAGGLPVVKPVEVPPALAEIFARTQAPAILQDLRTQARSAAGQLLHQVRTSADFLSLNQPQFLRRLDFIRRDLAALKELETRAGELMAQISEAALQRAGANLDGLSVAMQKRAETTVETAIVPREVLATQDSRTAFGRSLSSAARAAAFREFDQRVQSFAMDLNSARSLLLSNLGQVRVEAASHFEELTLNLGMDLYASWLGSKAPAWAANPLDISLDPGAGIASALLEAAQSVRQGIAAPDFVGAWGTGRIERMFKSEIAANAILGWSLGTVDQPLAAAVRRVWHRDTERPAGLLIGRLRAIVEAVTSGLAQHRIESLRLPRLAANRSRIAEIYRGFAVELEAIIQQKDSP